MKPHIQDLKLGSEIWALVDECQLGNQIIINFGGDLIRVTNETGRQFRVGERISLRVVAIKPLEFRIMTLSERNRVKRVALDLNV